MSKNVIGSQDRKWLFQGIGLAIVIIVLGIVFSWGVLITSVEIFGGINLDYFLLYLACIFWTLSYDTIYAYQDRKDDLNHGIKSTAVLFGLNESDFSQMGYHFFSISLGLYVLFNS